MNGVFFPEKILVADKSEIDAGKRRPHDEEWFGKKEHGKHMRILWKTKNIPMRDLYIMNTSVPKKESDGAFNRRFQYMDEVTSKFPSGQGLVLISNWKREEPRNDYEGG